MVKAGKYFEGELFVWSMLLGWERPVITVRPTPYCALKIFK